MVIQLPQMPRYHEQVLLDSLVRKMRDDADFESRAFRYPGDFFICDGLELFVRVRSTRAPQPASLRGADGRYEIDLVAGEEGVSPGQACVFYDAPSGQARVLGGGFIESAMATGATVRGAARPLVEALRG